MKFSNVNAAVAITTLAFTTCSVTSGVNGASIRAPSACGIDEALNILGANRCSTSSECDGARFCSAFGFCAGESGCPMTPVKEPNDHLICGIDEAHNALGPNRCSTSSECDGARFCTGSGFCAGESGCPVLPVTQPKWTQVATMDQAGISCPPTEGYYSSPKSTMDACKQWCNQLDTCNAVSWNGSTCWVQTCPDPSKPTFAYDHHGAVKGYEGWVKKDSDFTFLGEGGCADAKGVTIYKRFVLVAGQYGFDGTLQTCQDKCASYDATECKGVHYLPSHKHCHLLVEQDIELNNAGFKMSGEGQGDISGASTFGWITEWQCHKRTTNEN